MASLNPEDCAGLAACCPVQWSPHLILFILIFSNYSETLRDVGSAFKGMLPTKWLFLFDTLCALKHKVYYRTLSPENPARCFNKMIQSPCVKSQDWRRPGAQSLGASCLCFYVGQLAAYLLPVSKSPVTLKIIENIYEQCDYKVSPQRCATEHGIESRNGGVWGVPSGHVCTA